MNIPVLIISSILLLGCQAHAPAFKNATADNLDDTALAELSQVIGGAIKQENVRLNRQAFADNHILVLEHNMGGSLNGGLATGRIMEKPETFHLLTDGKRCVLAQLKTGARFELSKLRCTAVQIN